MAAALSLNRYAYVQGNVANKVDPSGLVGEMPQYYASCTNVDSIQWAWTTLGGGIFGLGLGRDIFAMPQQQTCDCLKYLLKLPWPDWTGWQNCLSQCFGGPTPKPTPITPTLDCSKPPSKPEDYLACQQKVSTSVPRLIQLCPGSSLTPQQQRSWDMAVSRVAQDTTVVNYYGYSIPTGKQVVADATANKLCLKIGSFAASEAFADPYSNTVEFSASTASFDEGQIYHELVHKYLGRNCPKLFGGKYAPTLMNELLAYRAGAKYSGSTQWNNLNPFKISDLQYLHDHLDDYGLPSSMYRGHALYPDSSNGPGYYNSNRQECGLPPLP